MIGTIDDAAARFKYSFGESMASGNRETQTIKLFQAAWLQDLIPDLYMSF